MGRTTFTVTVDEGHLDDLERLEAELTGLGFEVEETMPEIGAIFVAGDPDFLDRGRALDGVESIREEGVVQLPPLDESIPQ
jgi:hypothetical protein